MYRNEGSTCLRKGHFSVQAHFCFLKVSITFQSLGSSSFLGQKLNRFQPDHLLFFGTFAKTAPNVGGNNREHLSYILSEWAYGVGMCFVIFFSRGDDTANCGPSAYAHTEAVFMTTILLKGWNILHFLQHCQVYANLLGGLASFFRS